MEGQEREVAHPRGNLIWLAIAGGSIGALLGMYLFRHKTKHKKFSLGIPAILLIQVGLFYYFILR